MLVNFLKDISDVQFTIILQRPDVYLDADYIKIKEVIEKWKLKILIEDYSRNNLS